MNTQKGQRDKLEKYLNLNQKIEVVMNVSGPSVYDFTCFGLDANGKLSDDRYMIFYNQTNSPKGAISYAQCGNRTVFGINLSLLPAKIQRLAFTVSIDGFGNMGMIQNHTVQIMQNNQSALELALSSIDFQRETAIITMEFYKKGVWRFSMTASGFNGGLGDLLRHYGGEVQAQPVPTLTPTPMQNPMPMQTQMPMQAPVQTQPPVPMQTSIQNLAQVSMRVQALMPQPTPLKMETKPPLQTPMPMQPPRQMQPQMQSPMQMQFQNQVPMQTQNPMQVQQPMQTQPQMRTQVPAPVAFQQNQRDISQENKLK